MSDRFMVALGSTEATTSAMGATSTQLLANAGFEEGASGWSGTIGDINVRAPDAAHGGSYLAWMGGYGQAHSETLYQTVDIPARSHSVQFSFWLNIDTEETTRTRAYDRLYVQVRSADGHVLKTLATYSNLNRTRGYVERTFDLSHFAGQNVEVCLRATEDNGKSSSFFLDDFTLVVR